MQKKKKKMHKRRRGVCVYLPSYMSIVYTFVYEIVEENNGTNKKK